MKKKSPKNRFAAPLKKSYRKPRLVSHGKLAMIAGISSISGVL